MQPSSINLRVCGLAKHAPDTSTLVQGGSKKGSQVNYVRQVPKFLQAHAHLLGKGAKAGMVGPEGATLDVDSDAEADFEHDDGVRCQQLNITHVIWCMQPGC